MKRAGGRDRWILRILSMNVGNVGLRYANSTYEARANERASRNGLLPLSWYPWLWRLLFGSARS